MGVAEQPLCRTSHCRAQTMGVNSCTIMIVPALGTAYIGRAVADQQCRGTDTAIAPARPRTATPSVIAAVNEAVAIKSRVQFCF